MTVHGHSLKARGYTWHRCQSLWAGFTLFLGTGKHPLQAKLQAGSAPDLAIFCLLKLKPALNFIFHLQITCKNLALFLTVSIVM